MKQVPVLDNYRSISLFNVDPNLLSHVLTQRLTNVLAKPINVAQTGYAQHISIGFNLR